MRYNKEYSLFLVVSQFSAITSGLTDTLKTFKSVDFFEAKKRELFVDIIIKNVI
jgi:hypothetical protein